jgi:HSP20 family molecular chaperone IbpA
MKNLPSIWKTPFIRSSLDELMRLDDKEYFSRLDDLWDSMLQDSLAGRVSLYGIAQKTENDKHIVQVDVPGFKKDEINITYEKNFLSVVGETKDKTRSVKKFFNIPTYVTSVELPDAKLEDGILTIVFKVETEKEKNTQIKIK